MTTAKRFEMNDGSMCFAVLDASGKCIYFLHDKDEELVDGTVAAYLSGGDPIKDGWEGGEEDPQECYESVLAFVEARNGGTWEVDL